MGVTIHYRLGQNKKFVPATLDRAQRFAEELKKEQASVTNTEVDIHRVHPYRLIVTVGNCESLVFAFGGWKHWKEKGEKSWSYEKETLPQVFGKQLEDEPDTMWCSAFCKTQFADALLEHRWVAEILRMVASYCQYADVSDDGDYYHSGKIEDAAHAIQENGALISSLSGQLKEQYGEENVITGGETKIKPLVRRCAANWCRTPAKQGSKFCDNHEQNEQ